MPEDGVDFRHGYAGDRLPLCIGQIPVPVAVFDRDMHYLAASPAWGEIEGRDPGELIGQDFCALRAEVDDVWRRLPHEILTVGKRLQGEHAWVAADGTRKWLKWTAQPWCDDTGAVAGIILAAEDIGARRQGQRELEAARAAADRAGQLLSEAVASIPQGFAIYDAEDRLLLCNETYLGCYGTSRDLFVPGAAFEDIVRIGAERGQYPQAAGRLDAWVAERLAIHRAADGKPFEQYLDDGRWLLVMEFRTPSGCIVGNRIDITDRKRAEEKLRQSATVIASAQEGIVITDPDGYIVEVNPAFSRVTEYAEEELKGRHIRLIQSGRHDRTFYQQMWDSIHASGSWQGEIWNRRRSGEIYLEWLSISALRDAAGRITHYVGIGTDLSRMKHAQTELERLAHHDPLTRLPNRLLLMSRLEHAVSRAERNGGLGAVLFVDLDRFKAVNDTFGHLAGDEVLKQVVRRLKKRLRDSDTLARLGGDEFVVILEDLADTDAAAQVADDLVAEVIEPFVLADGRTARIGASIGMAFFPQDGAEAFRLLDLADQALYEAKKRGGGQTRRMGPFGHAAHSGFSPMAADPSCE